ncbi:MAG: ribonuclease P protein component [Desulfobulbaceae bacterium]|nr:ribonuclease P protein component [Desulfobulbaceae bacterium]
MKKFELTRDAILKKPWEFEQVYRRGKRVRGNGFAVIYLPNGQDSNRLGISVHGKLRGAVRRNRIKRIFRESFRLHRTTFPSASDIVIAVRPEFVLHNPEAIHSELQHMFAKCSPKGLRDV